MPIIASSCKLALSIGDAPGGCDKYFWRCLNPSVGVTACFRLELVGPPLPYKKSSAGKHMEAIVQWF